MKKSDTLSHQPAVIHLQLLWISALQHIWLFYTDEQLFNQTAFTQLDYTDEETAVTQTAYYPGNILLPAQNFLCTFTRLILL